MYLKPLRIRVYPEAGIFQDIILAFQHLVHRRPFRRGLEMRCLFQFEFVGHILTLDFQRAVRIVSGNVSVEHIFQHAVVAQLDIDALSDLECRLVNQTLRAAFLDDDTVISTPFCILIGLDGSASPMVMRQQRISIAAIPINVSV